MLIAIWPLLIAIVGLLIWALAGDRAAQAGFVLFWAGTLATCFEMSSHTVRIGGALVALWPVVVAIVGLLIWAFAGLSPNPPRPPRPKLSKVGYVLFWCGTLATCFALATHTVRIG